MDGKVETLGACDEPPLPDDEGREGAVRICGGLSPCRGAAAAAEAGRGPVERTEAPDAEVGRDEAGNELDEASIEPVDIIDDDVDVRALMRPAGWELTVDDDPPGLVDLDWDCDGGNSWWLAGRRRRGAS